MERRTFIQGAFGLVVLAAGASVGTFFAGAGAKDNAGFVTPTVEAPEAAAGPVMQPGIELSKAADNTIASYNGQELFVVDETGAELVRLADGSLTMDEIAACVSTPVATADVAEFFVSLGKAGYLQNEVYVNLVEVTA